LKRLFSPLSYAQALIDVELLGPHRPAWQLFSVLKVSFLPFFERVPWLKRFTLQPILSNHTTNFEGVEELLTGNFAGELEYCGLWLWAVFALFHLEQMK
jgi:hypothetical protein